MMKSHAGPLSIHREMRRGKPVSLHMENPKSPRTFSCLTLDQTYTSFSKSYRESSVSAMLKRKARCWTDLHHVNVCAVVAKTFECDINLTTAIELATTLEDLGETSMSRRTRISVRHSV